MSGIKVSSHFNGTVNNQGSISIGTSAATNINFGLDVYRGTFTNNGGQITVDRCMFGISGFHPDGSFLNNGTVKIGALQNVPDMISEEPGADLIFVNNAGGLLQGTGNIPSAYFTAAEGTSRPVIRRGK